MRDAQPFFWHIFILFYFIQNNPSPGIAESKKLMNELHKHKVKTSHIVVNQLVQSHMSQDEIKELEDTVVNSKEMAEEVSGNVEKLYRMNDSVLVTRIQFFERQ
jgi:hypothetical protein